MKIKIENYWDESYWSNFMDYVQLKFQETGNNWNTSSVEILQNFVNQHLSEYRGETTSVYSDSMLVFEDATGYFEFQLEWS
jgi:hypothetical protein